MCFLAGKIQTTQQKLKPEVSLGDPMKPKGASQIKTIMVSPMFEPEIVALYKALNEQDNSSLQINPRKPPNQRGSRLLKILNS